MKTHFCQLKTKKIYIFWVFMAYNNTYKQYPWTVIDDRGTLHVKIESEECLDDVPRFAGGPRFTAPHGVARREADEFLSS